MTWLTVAAPSVSVIVLNWNGLEDLKTCLASLIQLDYPAERLELIVCDNGSSDGSVQFVRSQFPSVRMVALDRNYGFAEGNNRAAAEARNDWIAFLNNDLRVPQDWLRSLVAPLYLQPDLASIASRIMTWDGTEVDFVGGSMNFYGHAFQLNFREHASRHDEARRILFACGGAMLVRREIFLEVGGFDSDFFIYFEDVDLGWRLNVLGYDVWYTPDATVYHRHHGATKNWISHGVQVLYDRNALWSIYKCFDDDNLSRVLPAALMLHNERGLMASGLDTSVYAVGGEPVRQPTGRAAYMTRALAYYRENGLRRTAKRSADIVHGRISGRFVPPSHAVVPLHALSSFVATSAFAHKLPQMALKRRWIQERRRRTDAEIFPMFVEPMRPDFPDPGYAQFLAMLAGVFAIEEQFRS